MNQHLLHNKIVIFVVISFLVVTLVYSLSSGFEASAAPRDPNNNRGDCNTFMSDVGNVISETCCWKDDNGVDVCQACTFDMDGARVWDCGEVEPLFERPLQGVPLSNLSIPVLPEGALEVSPTDEGTAPLSNLSIPTEEISKVPVPPKTDKGTEGDADKDGIVDSKDNCISTANPGQEDTGGVSGIGDACEPTIIGEEEGDAPSSLSVPEEQPPAVDIPQDQSEQEETQDQGQQDEGNDNDGGETSNPEQEPQ